MASISSRVVDNQVRIRLFPCVVKRIVDFFAMDVRFEVQGRLCNTEQNLAAQSRNTLLSHDKYLAAQSRNMQRLEFR